MADEGYCWDGCSCKPSLHKSKYHCLKHGICDCCGLRDKGVESQDRNWETRHALYEYTIKEVYSILSKEPNLLRAIELSRMIIEKLGLK